MKKNYLHRLGLLVLLLTVCLSSWAQKAVNVFNEDSSKVVVHVNLNRTKMALEDEVDKENGVPLRIATLYPLSVDMNGVGEWITRADSSQVWKFAIKSPGSYGLIVRYSDFYIPQGGKLYVYNNNEDNMTSVYRHEQNEAGGAYSTEVIFDDEIILEYVAPKEVVEKPRFMISDIGYKYKDLYEGFYSTRTLNDPETVCIPNINCPEGSDWQKQKQGVVRLRVQIGRDLYTCTGALVNNVKQDKKPYVLSAYHCFFIYEENQGLNIKADMESVEFYFDDEFSGCQNELVRPADKKVVGAKGLVFSPLDGGSDGALLEIQGVIPSAWDFYLNGWDIVSNENNITKGAVIHHPVGDVKKISLFTDKLVSTTWVNDEGTGSADGHYKAIYSVGVTQGGSSGSPLFSQNGLIIASLTGGSSSCKNNKYPDYYGKLSHHWANEKDPNMRMKTYLDPENKGTTTLAGIFRSATVEPPIPGEEAQNLNIYWTTSGVDVELTTDGDVISEVRVTNLKGYHIYTAKNVDLTRFNIPFSDSWPYEVRIISVKTKNNVTFDRKVMRRGNVD